MKKILLFVLLISLFSCKKDEEITGETGETGAASDLVIHTYLGYAGYRVAYDTIVNGVLRDTFHYTKPIVFSELENTEIVVTLNGSPVANGSTNTNGEFTISGLLKENVYTVRFKSKTFQSNTNGAYHYSGDFDIIGSQVDMIKKYHIHLGSGIGRTQGQGSTSTPETNPWTE